MGEFTLVGHYPYLMIVVLMMIGIWGMAMKRSFMKKIIGMTIFQTAIYLLFIHGATKSGATIPVRAEELGTEAAVYINPLPQVIVLTAIVVGVATTGVALALILQIQRRYGTVDEREVLKKMGDPS